MLLLLVVVVVVVVYCSFQCEGVTDFEGHKFRCKLTRAIFDS